MKEWKLITRFGNLFQYRYKIEERTEDIVLYLAMYVRKLKILNVKVYETHSLVTLSCVRYSVISSSFLCSL